MKKTQFLYAILLSIMVLFTACEEDSDEDEPTGNNLCLNGIMDGDETGVDCDADPTTDCPPCEFCGDGLLSSILNPGDETGMYEFDIDCGTPECGPCTQELVVQAIGEEGGETSFRDQYSYNRLLASAGQDTLALDPAIYPGLRVDKFPGGIGGPAFLRITANQGIMTDTDGIFMRTVILHIPWPENIAPVDPFLGPSITTEMVDASPFVPGGCSPPFIGQENPYVIYKEELIDNPQILSRCFFSYVDNGENSELSIDHLVGYIEYDYYVKGGVNMGSLLYQPIPLPGVDDVEGAFTDLSFKVHYPYLF